MTELNVVNIRKLADHIEKLAPEQLFAHIGTHWDLLTPKIVAGVLRGLADTGEVKWPEEVWSLNIRLMEEEEEDQ